MESEGIAVELYFNGNFMATLRHDQIRRVGTFEDDTWEIRYQGHHVMYWRISSRAVGVVQRFVLTKYDLDIASSRLNQSKSTGKKDLEAYWHGKKQL